MRLFRWWRPPLPKARLRNERAQLEAIRDDAQRVMPGSTLHAWIQGAIFTLIWLEGEPGARSPSWGAAWTRDRRGQP